MKRVYGLPAEPGGRLRAYVELTIARIHLARAEDALREPKRRRQTWLFADVRRAEKTVDGLAKRTARGPR